MKSLKRFVRLIALALAIALLVPMLAPATKVQAAETGTATSYTLEVGENAYLEYEETDTVRTAVYYENGIALQRSVYYLETGVILYYDLSQNTGNSHSRTFDMRQQNVVEYHIDDFKKTEETADVEAASVLSVASARGLDQNLVYDDTSGGGYTYLKSCSFTEDGVTYNRSLYGFDGYRNYKGDYDYFKAGVAISTVSLVLGDKVDFLVQLGLFVAGILVSAASVTDWIKDSFWNYQFTQFDPEYISFNCSGDYVYMRERQVDVNGDIVEWETVYEKEAREIELERELILLYPECA